MDPILLYGFPMGSSMGLVAALEWLGRPYRLCRVDVLGEMLSPSYARINPRHETPALITEQGDVLTETMAIAAWLEARDTERRISFDPLSPKADRMHQLMAFVNTGFTGAFAPLWVAMEGVAMDDAMRSALREFGRRKVIERHDKLEGMIEPVRFLLADRPTSPMPYWQVWRAGSTSTPSRRGAAGQSWRRFANNSRPIPGSSTPPPWRAGAVIREQDPARAISRWPTSSRDMASKPNQRRGGAASIRSSSLHRPFLELPRQRPPVHSESSCRFRDVEVGLDQGLVDAFPFQRLDRGRPGVERDLGIACGLVEGGLDVVGVRGLGEIMACAELDGLDGGGDAGKARQHHDQHLRIVRVQELHAGQSRGAAELEVDDGIAERSLLQNFPHVVDRGGEHDLVVAALERTLQGAGKAGIVLNDDERTVRLQSCLRSRALRAAA